MKNVVVKKHKTLTVNLEEGSKIQKKVLAMKYAKLNGDEPHLKKLAQSLKQKGKMYDKLLEQSDEIPAVVSDKDIDLLNGKYYFSTYC